MQPAAVPDQIAAVVKSASPRLAKYVLSALGLSSVLLGVFDPAFRDSEGNFTGLLIVPVSVGLGLLLLAKALGGVSELSAFWFSTALIGHAVSLQLINAGWQLRYQHYKPLGEIAASGTGMLFVMYLFLQAVVVAFALRAHITPIVLWSRRNLAWWQIVFIAAAFVVPTTTVSHDVSVYLKEWAFAVLVQLVSLGAILLAALTMPAGFLERVSDRISAFVRSLRNFQQSEPSRPDRFVICLAAFVVLVAAATCVLAYELHPHVTDEVTYLIQARLFASGALTMPSPPVPEAFETFLVGAIGDRWFPVTPPGWSFVLAGGVLLGIPWLVNPLLAGLNLILAYVLITELYSRSFAKISVLLLAISPWYVFLGMSLMTHMLSLTLTLAAAIALAWSRRRRTIFWTWIAGAAVGGLSTVRPLEAVAVAAVLGGWALAFSDKALRIRMVLGLTAGAMMVGSIGLWYNAAFTGNPLEFPINSYTDQQFGKNSNALGFGPDRGMGWALDPNPGHGPVDALINTNLNVSSLNTELFGWSIGSFLLVALGVCLGRLERSAYLMLSAIGLIYGLHFFYYFSGGPDFGARYWFLMIVPLIVLAARGIAVLGTRIGGETGSAPLRVLATVLALCVMSIVVFIPWRAMDKYHNFRGMRPDIRSLTEAYDFGPSLVLIQGNNDPDFASAAVYNPLDLSARQPVYAWDRDLATRSRLIEAYPDRPVWIIQGPSITGRGYEVIRGPIAAGELIGSRE